MSLELKGYRLSLVFCPTDMRYGFLRLRDLAKRCVGIDLDQCRDCVVFVSRDRAVAKMVWTNDKGSFLLTRRLNNGRFQQLLARIDAGESMTVKKEMLLKYLDGGEILSQRTDYHQGS